jgi:hypothetical protein
MDAVPGHRDLEEAALIAESKRLIAEMDELIRRAKVLQAEHNVVVAKIKEKHGSDGST